MYAPLKWNDVFAKHNHHGERKTKNARLFHTQHFDPRGSRLTHDTRVSKCQSFVFPSQKDKLSLLPLQHTPLLSEQRLARQRGGDSYLFPHCVAVCVLLCNLLYFSCYLQGGAAAVAVAGGRTRWGGGTDESCWWDSSSFRFSLVNPASGTLPLLLAKEQRQQ